MNDDEGRLIGKLQRIEALQARAGSEGERAAAASAAERIRKRLAELAGSSARTAAGKRSGAGGEAARSRGAGNGEEADGCLDRPRAVEAGADASRPDAIVDYRFSVSDDWSRQAMVALLRHHGIETYRRRNQRRTTVRARVSRRFVDDVIWPQFKALSRTLRSYLDAVTERVVAAALAPGRNEEHADALDDLLEVASTARARAAGRRAS